MKFTRAHVLSIVSAVFATATVIAFATISPGASAGRLNKSNADFVDASEIEILSCTTAITEVSTASTASTSTTSTTHTTTSKTTSSTTTTSTTSTTTTTEVTTSEPIITETATTTVETEPTTEPPTYEYSWWSDGENWYFEPSGWVIDNKSYYVLCNCVAHEAGCNWISTYNKALVCEVIFNRFNWWGYGSIYDVVAARNQFTGSGGYVNLECYSNEVNDDVINAVAFYCSYPEIFNEGYTGFYGDGRQNHFH